VLLLIGTAIGAGGVILVQERYLPPRLSASDTVKLRSDYEGADAARLRLQGELADTTKQLQAALAEKKKLADGLATSVAAGERTRQDLAAVVAALPPDPRGGAVEVRAAQFTAHGSALAYDMVLTRQRVGAQPTPGVVQFTVAGVSARGVDTTLNPQQVTVSLGAHEVVRGNLALPEGFRPRETTIQVLDRSGGRALGMRVLPVK
jgi:hypothetical protein